MQDGSSIYSLSKLHICVTHPGGFQSDPCKFRCMHHSASAHLHSYLQQKKDIKDVVNYALQCAHFLSTRDLSKMLSHNV